MPPFDIEEVYGFESWEMPGKRVEFTLMTVSGTISAVITKDEAEALVDQLLKRYPHWGTLRRTPSGVAL